MFRISQGMLVSLINYECRLYRACRMFNDNYTKLVSLVSMLVSRLVFSILFLIDIII